MRFSLIAIVVLLSSSAWACPQLAGKYSCADGSGQSVVTQTVSNRITTFDIDSLKMVADGKTRTESDPEDADTKIKSTWKCNGTRSLDGTVTSYVDGHLFIKMAISFLKTAKGYTMNATASGPGGVSEEGKPFVCLTETEE